MRVFRIRSSILSLACVLSWFSAPVTAFDFTPNPAQILSDPAYLPSAQQLAGATTYQFAGTNSTHTVTQNLSYGIVNNVTAWGAASYTWPATFQNINLAVNGPTFKDRYDPIVGVTWRALDQQSTAFNLDLSASAPGLLDAAASWQTHDLTVLARGGVYYANSDSNVDGMRTYDPFWACFVQLRSQLRLTQKLSLNVDGKYTDPFGSAHNGPNWQPKTQNFQAQLNYHLIQDRLVLQAGYQQQWAGLSFAATSTYHALVLGLLYTL